MRTGMGYCYAHFESFHTELRELLRAMNYRKDKRKFLSLEKDERYAHLSKETWEAIATMTGRSFLKKTEKHTKVRMEIRRSTICVRHCGK